MSEELKRLANDVSLGGYDSLPDLIRLAMREGKLKLAGPPQIMIRRMRDGRFWTGGTSVRSEEWDPVRARTYLDLKRAKQAAGHVRNARSMLAGLTREQFAELSRQVIVEHHEVRADGKISAWFCEEVEIVEVAPLELGTVPVERKT